MVSNVPEPRSTNVVSAAARDYLATPVIAAFYEAREHEVYHWTLKRAALRRDFHEQMVPVLERFVEITEDPAAVAAVDQAIAGSGRRGGRSQSGGVLAITQAEQPKGTRLLGLSEPLTFESLKFAYRRAARVHHPDAGGQHEAMVAINEAFSLAHHLLEQAQLSGAIEGGGLIGSQVITCDEYRYHCAVLVLRTMVDQWNVDAASRWLTRITSAAWRGDFFRQDKNRRIALTEVSGTLATRLVAAGLTTEAHQALAVAEKCLRAATSEGLFYDVYVKGARDAVGGLRRPRIVLNHPRQAEHALRLGIIDEARFQKVIAKHAAARAAEAEGEREAGEELRRFHARGGFIVDLPTDVVARGKQVRGNLVPEPDYFMTRIAALTPDQQAEYLKAFGPDGPLMLVRKYTFVRLVSLLESVLLFPGLVESETAAREAEVLGALRDGTHYATLVASHIRDMAEESLTDRRTRASLLSPVIGGRESQTGLGGGMLLVGARALAFPLTPDYMAAVHAPLDSLRRTR